MTQSIIIPVKDRNDLMLSLIGNKVKAGYKIFAIKKHINILNDIGYDIAPLEPLPLPIITHPTYFKLFEYQKDAVNQVLTTPHKGALIYLSCGLGKTITAITANEIINPKQTLIICSKRLMIMWSQQLKQWSKDGNEVDFCIWHKDYNKVWNEARYIITNIESFRGINGKRDDRFNRQWPLIIFDESLHLKNRKSNINIMLKKSKYDRILLLSGNPIKNYYDDLYAQLSVIDSSIFSSYWKMADEYCYVLTNAHAKQVIGNRKANPAIDYSDFIIRKTQEQELPDLPKIIYRHYDIDLSMEQRTAHDILVSDMLIQLDNGSKLFSDNKLVNYGRLMQIISSYDNIEGNNYISAKHDMLLEMIETNDIQYPAIVWVNYRNGANSLYSRLRHEKGLRVGLYIGGSKDSVISDYIGSKLDIIVMGLEVGKHGHTLTNTKSAVYIDRNFDGDTWYQSLKRVERIGLTHRPIMTTIKARNSIDNVVDKILAGKMQGIAQLADSDHRTLLESIRSVK